MSEWLPVLIALIVAFAFAAGTIVLSTFIVPRRGNREKLSPYECGVDPLGTARERFSIKFYLVAVLFILFDIEAVFLYPWAVTFRDLGWIALVEMALFIAVLFVGYIYILKKGALEWD